MMSRVVKGLFLLLTFGAVCGVGAGLFVGSCLGLLLAIGFTTAIRAALEIIGFGLVAGALIGLLPGLIYGLASYYFVKSWHWLVDGGIYGGVGFLLVIQLANRPFDGLAFWVCALCGIIVGVMNTAFPAWWGRKLHAEGVNLLRKKN